MTNEDPRLAPDGTEWWLLKTWPGMKRPFGGEVRAAAWLWFNKDVGDTFTMKEVRTALGDGEGPEDAEQLSRRLRHLREKQWILETHSDDSSVPVHHYRLTKKGLRAWLGERADSATISAADRHQVFARDGYRCKICGVGDGESYPDYPGKKASLTVGHRIPQNRGGRSGRRGSLDNLRTECKLCNEAVRDRLRDPETFEEAKSDVKNLGKPDKRVLLEWIEAGERQRSKLDTVYDRVRKLSPGEIDQMRGLLVKMVYGEHLSEEG
ncbi:HNH endonuclease [Streptomyces sp. NBC_00191]|uniref:HNH endonuclease n=1 Tax=Streptomyces sp. NBC_00191 TaxID=2975674 RepID=UPI0032454312